MKSPKPRYDEVYWEGVAWLDAMAEDPDEWKVDGVSLVLGDTVEFEWEQEDDD